MAEKENPISEQSEKLPKPPELSGVSLSQPSSATLPTNDEKESARTLPLSSSEDSDKFSFLSFVHDFVWASTQFAEQKAGFVFAAATAFLGYLVTTIPSYFFGVSRLRQALIISALTFLMISIVTVVSIITPRLSGNPKGLVYFGAISSQPNAAIYTANVLHASRSELDSAVADHIFELAGICSLKQRRIRLAMGFGSIGFLLGLIWLILLHGSVEPLPHSWPDLWNH